MASFPESRLKPHPLWRPSELSRQALRVWLRVASFSVLILSIAFLSAVVFGFDRRGSVAGGLMPSLFASLCFALFLNIYALQQLRLEHKEADRAFQNADCEFSSIFRNVLDGVLILDDKGNCLDANPAAKLILRVSTGKLIGESIGNFLADGTTFKRKWNSFLREKTRRGRLQLIAGDGQVLFVDFAATANYLPGRHVLILCDVTERARGEVALRESEARFRYMAENIQEVFWMMDAQTGEIRYANPAYETLTGRTVESLYDSPSSYRELVHPDDRTRVLTKIENLTEPETLDEEFRFIRADGQVHWAWAKGVAVSERSGKRWIIGTAQDVTTRKHAELRVDQQLRAVEAARAEAEALRKATLALSQNLAMDSVLDTLLHCISELVPFDKATVLFVEDGANLMIAREAPQNVSKRIGLILNVAESVFLQRVLFEKQAVLLLDVCKQSQWREIRPLDGIHCWLGVPLVAGGQVLGILSLGAKAPSVFTAEHLRLTKSLAVPAAVAIQNARTHERAEIYAAELEARLLELQRAEEALKLAGGKGSRSNSGLHPPEDL
jgi:PAS domain S-box-containing protein